MATSVASVHVTDFSLLRAIRLMSVLLFLLAVALALPQRALANLTMEVGGIARFPVTGSNPPLSGADWTIVLNGTTIASSLVPNGWYVGGSLTGTGDYQPPSVRGIVVGAPFSVAIAANYEVRAMSAAGSGPPPSGNAIVGTRRGSAAPPAVFAGKGRGNAQSMSIGGGGGTPMPISANFDIVPGLTLTQAGLDRGFGLSIFATRFPAWPGLSPLSALVESAGVLVTAFTGEVRVFATDTDQQYAADASMGMSIPYSNTMCLALLNGSIYMAQQDYSDVVQLNPNGSLLQTAAGGIHEATGLVADPFNGHLFASDGYGGSIYEIDPVAHTSQVILAGFRSPDGMAVSSDGKTLYIAVEGEENIIGVDIRTHQIVYDYNQLNPFCPIPDPDGIALGSGVLKGYAYINTNVGTVYEISLASGACTLIASGGTRGDFVTPDPNGTLFISQLERIKRLIPPAGGSFGGGGSIVTRDDRTSPNTTPYAPFTLSAPAVTALSAQNARFDLTGFQGVVALGNILRTGQLGWNTGDRFDLAFGMKSAASSGPVSYGPMMWQVQNSASDPAPYTYGWDLPLSFLSDASSGLGGVYQASLIDEVGSGGPLIPSPTVPNTTGRAFTARTSCLWSSMPAQTRPSSRVDASMWSWPTTIRCRTEPGKSFAIRRSSRPRCSPRAGAWRRTAAATTASGSGRLRARRWGSPMKCGARTAMPPVSSM